VSGPLDGIVVIACEQAVSAPFATRHLADLGARVIKIERPGTGDFARGYDTSVNGLSSHFVWLNRNKESVALDLKTENARRAMDLLLARADVFIQNLAPGAADRLGLGAASLRRRFPRLVTCSISGYGSSGPYARSKSYDLLIQAEAGLMSLTGEEDAPAKAGFPAADVSAGMYAFSSIMTALFARERTGEGTDLEVSMFDSLTEWLGFSLHYTRYDGEPPLRRTGTSHSAITPYGRYLAGDGTEFVIAVQNDREWARLCEQVLGQPELVNDPRLSTTARRSAHRDLVEPLVAEGLRRYSGADLEERLTRASLPYARMRDIAEVVEHPQMTSRERWTTVATSAGPVATLRPPVTAPDWPERTDPVPAVGEHTERVLEWIGLADGTGRPDPQS
jgi:crotonobetainyl-CoA:carnitine CoA-transferase CaiB-like acyl-CoA transferase